MMSKCLGALPPLKTKLLSLHSGRVIVCVFIAQDILVVQDIGDAKIESSHSLEEIKSLTSAGIQTPVRGISLAKGSSPDWQIGLGFAIPFPAQKRRERTARSIRISDAERAVFL